MRALGNPPPARPGFGRPAAITARAFRHLPEAMQAEAALLLREMGETMLDIAARLHVDEGEVFRLLRGPLQPLKAGGYADFTPVEG